MDQGGREVDAVLVTRARLGDASAFASLVERYLDELHDHVARVVGDANTTLAATTFEVALGRLGALRDPGAFRVWLYGIAGELLAGQQRLDTGRPPLGLTSGQRAVWRGLSALSLAQIRTVDLIVRRGLSTAEVTHIVAGKPERHLRRALRRLEDAVPEARRHLASLPAFPAPDAGVLAPHLLAAWPSQPAPARRTSHHGLVVWGAALAAVMLSMLVPAAIGLAPIQRQAAIAPAEYTAAPFTEAAGVPTPLPEEPEADVLPSLPPFEVETQEPEPQPTATAEPTPTPPPPSPTPTQAPSPTPSPAPQPSPSPTCLLPDTPACPTEPEPTPTETDTQSEGETSDNGNAPKP